MKLSFLHNKSLRITIQSLVGIGISIIFFLFVKQIIKDTSVIEQLTRSAGLYGPFILIVLMIVGILFSFIPSVVFIVLAGYLYGPWLGALYSYFAHILAALFVFSVVNRFKINTSTTHKKYVLFIKKNQNFLYLFYAIPLFPISVVSLMSANLGIPLKKFLRVIVLSFLPVVFFFSFFGYHISNTNLLELGISLFIVIILAVIFYRRIQSQRT